MGECLPGAGRPRHAPLLPIFHYAQTVRNPGIWLLAITYFFVYIVRQGATSWLMMYLMQVRGQGGGAG